MTFVSPDVYFAAFFNSVLMSVEFVGQFLMCSLVKFADDAKLGGLFRMLEGQGCQPGDLDTLWEWAHRNVVSCDEDKCKALPWERSTSAAAQAGDETALGSRWVHPGSKDGRHPPGLYKWGRSQ